PSGGAALPSWATPPPVGNRPSRVGQLFPQWGIVFPEVGSPSPTRARPSPSGESTFPSWAGLPRLGRGPPPPKTLTAPALFSRPPVPPRREKRESHASSGCGEAYTPRLTEKPCRGANS